MAQDRPAMPMDCTLSLVVDSNPLAVRAALSDLMRGLADKGVQKQALASVELVLAEALNNVVEHAYADTTGPIEILLRPDGAMLECRIRDRGTSMPGGTLPDGPEFPLDGPVRDLPEGGFGWYLIRKLAREIDYRRSGGQNQLLFRIRLDPPPR